MKHRSHRDGPTPVAAIERPRPVAMGSLLRELGPVVYYARRDAVVKIGFTTNLASRLRHLPQGFHLVAWRTGGSYELEAAIHSRLSNSVMRGREWYHATPEVMAEIADARTACGIARFDRQST